MSKWGSGWKPGEFSLAGILTSLLGDFGGDWGGKKGKWEGVRRAFLVTWRQFKDKKGETMRGSEGEKRG